MPFVSRKVYFFICGQCGFIKRSPITTMSLGGHILSAFFPGDLAGTDPIKRFKAWRIPRTCPNCHGERTIVRLQSSHGKQMVEKFSREDQTCQQLVHSLGNCLPRTYPNDTPIRDGSDRWQELADELRRSGCQELASLCANQVPSQPSPSTPGA